MIVNFDVVIFMKIIAIYFAEGRYEGISHFLYKYVIINLVIDMDIEEFERIKEEVSRMEDGKEKRKLEKQLSKVERKLKLNNFLTDVNDLLGDSNTKKTTYDFWGTGEETKVEGYEPYQLEEEEDELEDDDLYEKGED